MCDQIPHKIPHMASVYKHGKQWYAEWYRPDGSRAKRGTGQTSKKEAKRIAGEFEAKDRRAKDNSGRKLEEILSRATADARAGKLSAERSAGYLTELRQVKDPQFRVVSLAEMLDTWIDYKTTRVGEKTLNGYKDMRRRFTEALGSKICSAPVEDLTAAQIDKAMAKMKKDGELKGSTINLDLSALRQALKKAQEDGIVAKNVAASVDPLPEDDSDEKGPFEAAEVRKMMDHPQTTEEWHGMILSGGHTGLRLGDIAKLGEQHLDGTDLVIRPKKTSRSKKVIRIPLTPPLIAWTKGKNGLFFPDAAATAISTLSMQFSAIMKRAGIPAKVTLPGGIEVKRSFHSLRHSFTSWLAEADIHADVRKKLTGHASDAQHAKYTHHDEALSRAVATLPTLSSRKRSGA